MSEKTKVAAEKEAVEVEESGVGTYVFKKPTKIDGDEVTEISYDLSDLTGAAIRRAKADLQKRGYTVAVKELDECFHAALFAQASGLTIDNVEGFAGVDYMNVANIVRDFLYIGE